ncbi:hypothetical protein V8C37DRAFT_409332 [Trichoderma ceciliae]
MESGESLLAARPNSSSTLGSNNGGRAAPRIRSRVACQSCNQRKVRCDVVQNGGDPCSNCQRDRGSCVVLPRKKHRPRRKRDTQFTSQDIAQNSPGISCPRTSSGVLVEQRGADTTRGGDLLEYFHGSTLSTSISPPRNNVMRAEAILPEDAPLTYIGDRRGPRHSMYDLCHPETPEEPRYLHPSTAATSSHKPHELEYMRLQGVFSKLSDDVCDVLVGCYFRHVHFFLPIIDASAFLNEYCSNGSRNISLLLYWSMLLAAANFVDADALQKAGFASRKAMKTAMYERAKCLYDVDRETDKLVLIQSVILLGFWYTDSQDHTGEWYWIGIAISLSQNLALHRSPRFSNRVQQRSSPVRESLVRRIWWACIVSDRWVSLARGRPMRIHNEDCDTSVPVVEDVLDELESVTDPARSKFLPTESRALAEMWIRLVRICDTLGNILRVHYRLQALAKDDVVSDRSSESLSIHACQIDLLYQATITILYRPYVLNQSACLPSGANSLWRETAASRAREAASNTNGLLQSLIELDALRYLKPMIITAMISAMQIHLYDCKSTNPLTRTLAENKLQLHMLVLSNLRETYWSADVTYRLFERAQTILNKAKSQIAIPNKKSNGRFSRVSSETNNGRDFVHVQQQLQPPPQQPQPNEVRTLMTPEPTMMLMSEQPPANSWFSTSPRFSDIDHLLSPGFNLSGGDFFSGRENDVVNDPLVLR